MSRWLNDKIFMIWIYLFNGIVIRTCVLVQFVIENINYIDVSPTSGCNALTSMLSFPLGGHQTWRDTPMCILSAPMSCVECPTPKNTVSPLLVHSALWRHNILILRHTRKAFYRKKHVCDVYRITYRFEILNYIFWLLNSLFKLEIQWVLLSDCAVKIQAIQIERRPHQNS